MPIKIEISAETLKRAKEVLSTDNINAELDKALLQMKDDILAEMWSNRPPYVQTGGLAQSIFPDRDEDDGMVIDITAELVDETTMSELTRETIDEMRGFADKFLEADNRIDRQDAKYELVTRFLYWLMPLLDAAQRGIECERKLRILYEIGITDADNAEMHRRYDAESGAEGAGDVDQ